MLALLPLLPRPGTGLAARAFADVVSFHCAGVSQWPGMASATNGQSGDALSEARQLFCVDRGLAARPAIDGSAVTDQLASAHDPFDQSGQSSPSPVVRSTSGTVLLVDG